MQFTLDHFKCDAQDTSNLFASSIRLQLELGALYLAFGKIKHKMCKYGIEFQLVQFPRNLLHKLPVYLNDLGGKKNKHLKPDCTGLCCECSLKVMKMLFWDIPNI